MKKRTIKNVTWIMTAVLVLGLAACGGRNSGGNSGTSESGIGAAESQAETAAEVQAAEETQAVQSETEAPEDSVQAEAAGAYLQILRRDESRIRAYNWANDWGSAESRPVAITDVNGDEIPELIYVAVSEDADRAMFAADLHIYTYEADENEAEELYDQEMWDVAVAGGSRYCLFMEKDGSFWAYTSSGDEQWTNTFERFSMKGDDDMELSLQVERFTYPNENYTDRVEEYTGAGGEEISADDYENKKAALIDSFLLCVLAGNLDDEELNAAADRAGSAAMTYDEAVQYLQGEAGASGTKDIDADTLFAAVDDLAFWFASGAGAWSTDLEIDEDGSFSGVYHDSDMGDAGDDYPNGTRYICEFEGRFASPERIDDYSYRLKLEDISYEKKPGTIWIEDGVRCIAADAYGLTSDDAGTEAAGGEFILYLPGAPTADLPQEFIDSIRMPRAWSTIPEKLPVYGLYNVKGGVAFSADTEAAGNSGDMGNASEDQGILPESSQRLLTSADVTGMSDDDIQLAINTIYARHGYQFKDSELLEYFKGFDWYQPIETNMENVQKTFSEIEEENVKFLAGKL